MYVLNLFKRCLPVFVLATSLGFANDTHIVEHHDPIEIDSTLSLPKLVDLTMAQTPDASWLSSLEQEAKALSERGQSWVAGAPQAGLRFQEATSGTLHYVDATINVPLWNFGQRDAQQTIGQQAQASAETQAAATKLRVAGLIRTALWDMELQKIRFEQAQIEVATFEKLQKKIGKQVELGDLPRADLLLAETELLQKRSLLILAEAELMHARKRYANITRTAKVPANFQENLVPLKELSQSHPALVALNSLIERKQAELNALELVGSGQTNLAIGVNSDRPSNNDPRSNKTESFNIGVVVPFGGSAHNQPHIAAINVELNKLIAEREQLYRDLEQAHHEAEHNLEVNQAALAIANELKQTSEAHFKMTQLSYSVGEINLLDLLKIQVRAQQAVLNAKERAVMLQRDQAFYNQAVGVLP
ncbi:MAG: TolC family protein [Methylococcaceae bacterium]|nr:TolC family protein [Methylococcaceae bacterium]MDP2393013.1 TolC family protein [Methylococcaceae bacterium]MDP3020497.1 TolC family protein [Methylococcaceae bacterium]MDP3389860.1 TolC family protein [Methylococcaceae bacterium]MDP3933478.1 TolC family protein [Methylococcaceae bacterium]